MNPKKDKLDHIMLAKRFNAPILTEGKDYLEGGKPTFPVAVEIRIARLTFRVCPGEREMLVAQLQAIEQIGTMAVLVEAYDLVADNHFWWGWTLIARGGSLYAVQRVIFPKRRALDFAGEVDQGKIFEVPAEMVSAWDAHVRTDRQAAA